MKKKIEEGKKGKMKGQRNFNNTEISKKDIVSARS